MYWNFNTWFQLSKLFSLKLREQKVKGPSQNFYSPNAWKNVNVWVQKNHTNPTFMEIPYFSLSKNTNIWFSSNIPPTSQLFSPALPRFLVLQLQNRITLDWSISQKNYFLCFQFSSPLTLFAPSQFIEGGLYHALMFYRKQ